MQTIEQETTTQDNLRQSIRVPANPETRDVEVIVGNETHPGQLVDVSSGGLQVEIERTVDVTIGQCLFVVQKGAVHCGVSAHTHMTETYRNIGMQVDQSLPLAELPKRVRGRSQRTSTRTSTMATTLVLMMVVALLGTLVLSLNLGNSRRELWELLDNTQSCRACPSSGRVV